MVGFLLLPLIPWFRHGRRPWILVGLFAVLLIQGTVIQSNWEFKHHLASIGLAFLIVGVPAVAVGILNVLEQVPMTPSLSHWTATTSNIAIAVVLGVTFFGFYAARAGQPLFGTFGDTKP